VPAIIFGKRKENPNNKCGTIHKSRTYQVSERFAGVRRVPSP
jgi:hypothetical protein